MKTALLFFAVLLVAALALPLLSMLLRLILTALVALPLLAVSLIAGIGYISLALAALVLVALYQSGLHLGWAIAIALCIGLGSALTLLTALWHELSQKVRAWSQNRAKNRPSPAGGVRGGEGVTIINEATPPKGTPQ